MKLNDANIHYLHTYYPTRYEEHNGVSKDIIALKNADQKQIIRFQEELIEGLIEIKHGNKDLLKGKSLALVPSHNANQWGSSLLQISSYICEYLEMIDASKVIVRTKTHDKLAYGGCRSIESHLETMKVDDKSYNIKGQQFIILDDISTTGASVRACARLLREAGAAQNVLGLVIAQTL